MASGGCQNLLTEFSPLTYPVMMMVVVVVAVVAKLISSHFFFLFFYLLLCFFDLFYKAKLREGQTRSMTGSGVPWNCCLIY